MNTHPRRAKHWSHHGDAIMDLFRDVTGTVADFGCGEGVFVRVSPGYLGLDYRIDLARDVRAAGGNSVTADIRFTQM